MDLKAIRDASEIIAEFAGLTDLAGRPVRFTVRRHRPDGSWLIELAPYLLGLAQAADVRSFAEGILATLEEGAGEPDFRLFADGYTDAYATVGYDGDELYFTAGAAFDYAQDFVGRTAKGEPLYRNPVGAAHLELIDVSPADPGHLTGCARALLAAL
ncbi:hypothetical protein ACQP25_26015 [Microtetraspora malaysiensis]|uniref:hypothetical protein n=1 Tax=Microtetraspora malaysiensis TaxID=161358 RepID=UPI003D95019A